ncbi:flagellar protein FlgN [Mariprofundus sp. EBB-1]|uniref:flagellar export chaperone FlgN n=1 Tax=Mariprofundus sp. EBB-1 TaxID=2650971 RepID=UPI000EF27892|nr:flagellar export chaperone FlgN [Mariprofundus sp. EBB-1]RLL55625.1 flagellar protein FlgN [Mariprofundus sp. EBB-1]
MVGHNISSPKRSHKIIALPANALEELHSVLEKMNVCALELEKIAQAEYEAIRHLDADQIMQLTDERIIAHQCLGQLEQQCRQLLDSYDVSRELSLSVVIDMYAGTKAAAFQSLRRNLYERMIKVDQSNQENKLRLHAAYNVTSNILQGLGLSQPEHTYNRRTPG